MASDRKVKEHPCPYEGCSALFWKNSKLVYHMRRHTGERPFVCDEPNCNKAYLYSFHLRRHKEVHAKKPSEQKVVCPHEGCGFELANKYSLQKHLKRKHSSKGNYLVTCDICQQGFFKKRQLLQHSYVHTGVLPFKCETCDARFLNMHERNRHMRTHSATYSCVCGENFERWSNLLKHKKECGKIEHICNVCDFRFKKADYLQKHIKLHFSDGSQTFKCGYDGCTRVYDHKKNLIHHIKYYHQKQQKRKCYCGYPDCNQSFVQKHGLILHIEKVHIKSITDVKKPRRPRKDKGIPKLDVAGVLVGLNISTKELNIESPKDDDTNIVEKLNEDVLLANDAKAA